MLEELLRTAGFKKYTVVFMSLGENLSAEALFHESLKTFYRETRGLRVEPVV